MNNYSPSPSMSPEDNEKYIQEMRNKISKKWYETEFVKKMLQKIGITSWVVMTIVLFLGGMILGAILNWMIGIPTWIICWIIVGVSIWSMSEYFEV